jgi:hypothetical protein
MQDVQADFHDFIRRFPNGALVSGDRTGAKRAKAVADFTRAFGSLSRASLTIADPDVDDKPTVEELTEESRAAAKALASSYPKESREKIMADADRLIKRAAEIQDGIVAKIKSGHAIHHAKNRLREAGILA